MNRIAVLRTAWSIALACSAIREPPGTIDTLMRAGLVSRQIVADLPGSPRGVEVRLRIQPEHASQRQRLLDAAAHALQDYARWFGPYPHDRLTMVDVPWRSGLARHAEPGVVAIESRWIVGAGSVAPEADVARAISRQWWGSAVRIEDATLTEELVEYSQGLTVERLFADRNGRPGYSALEARYFGGFVPWTNRAVRLTREAAVHGRPGGRLLTLERYLGWPALQRGLAAVTEQRGSGGMSRDRFFQIIGDTTGQDLQWFARAAFEERFIDYAVDGVTSVAANCGALPCFLTTVIARRNGAPFTGSSHEPLGGYESGRAIGLRVTFQDGATATDAWDGRSESKTFVYESRTQALSAEIDSDHMLVLDSRKANNSRRLIVNAPVAADRWSARWMVWLQDVLLSYASLV
jgi:hypothetical protein